MTRFEFATANRIIFGPGSIEEATKLPAAFGRRVLVIRGATPNRAVPLIAGIEAGGGAVTEFCVEKEPDTVMAARGAELARTMPADFVVGIGGGSVMDAAKAIAALATNTRDVLDYLEVVGRGEPLASPALPCVAVPTTAGTGSEATRNAVLASPEHRVKVSLRSPHMLPKIAIVDPMLTRGLPPELTATTGLDALTQLVEAYVSRRANPMTDALCREGIARAARALPRAVRDGHDLDARSDMSLASLWSGIALANAGLGAVHGFAGPIGGMFDAPHGGVCARLLPHVYAANWNAIRSRMPDHPSAGRFADAARLLTGRATASPEDAVDWTRELVDTLAVPALGAYGVTAAHVDGLVDSATKASSTKANPIDLTRDELAAALLSAL